jgi:DNA-binding NarL/FixJ family response regulator
MELSRGEQRVVELVERGLTNPEIAAILRVSRFTVRNQLASVFRKLQVSRRTELVYLLGRDRMHDR